MEEDQVMTPQHIDWRVRHGAAASLSEAVTRLGATVGEELTELAHCRAGLPDLADAIQQLRDALVAAERLAQHFDCHDLHAEEEARLPATGARPRR